MTPPRARARRTAAIISSILLPFAATNAAFSQGDAVPATTTDSIVDRITLEPLDQRVSDINPLGTSLRITDAGLAVPNDFGQVFRLPGDQHMLMRAQGGLYAVFPQSTYGTWEVRKTRERFQLPVVGQGTTFYIGAEALRAAFGMPESDDASEPLDRALPASMMTLAPPLNTRLATAVAPSRADDSHAASASRSAGASDENRPRRGGERNSVATGAADPDAHERFRSADLTMDHLPAIAADEDYRRTRIAELLRRAIAAEEE